MRYVPAPRRFAALLGLLALLAACGPAQPSAPAASKPSAAGSVSTSNAPAANAPAAGAANTTSSTASGTTSGTASGNGPAEWTVAIAEEAATLDPPASSSAASSMAQLHIFDSLIAFEGQNFQLTPRLAESWQALDDRTWEFKLRQGVKFHNGDDLTAADVRYSLDVYRADKSARKSYVEDVVGVEVIDSRTVRVITAGPNPGLLANLGSLGIMPERAREAMGLDAFGQAAIGSGAYRAVEFTRGQRLVLEANPNYWRGPVVPARLVLRPIADPSTRAAELKAGGAQIIAAPPIAQLGDLQGGDTELQPLKGARTIIYAFNTTARPFDDLRVRQAVNLAVDRESILKNVLEGNGELLHGPFASSWLGYDPSLQPYAYDPQRARQLLAEAGYPNGFETTFSTSNGAFLKDREIAEVIASQLGQVGIRLQIVPTERAKLQDDWIAGNFRGLTAVAWGSAADPDPMIGWALYKRKGHAPDDRLNGLIEQSRRVVDPAQRKQALTDMGRYVHEQAYWLFVHAQDEFYARRKDVPWVPYPTGQSSANMWYAKPWR